MAPPGLPKNPSKQHHGYQTPGTSRLLWLYIIATGLYTIIGLGLFAFGLTAIFSPTLMVQSTSNANLAVVSIVTAVYLIISTALSVFSYVNQRTRHVLFPITFVISIFTLLFELTLLGLIASGVFQNWIGNSNGNTTLDVFGKAKWIAILVLSALILIGMLKAALEYIFIQFAASERTRLKEKNATRSEITLSMPRNRIYVNTDGNGNRSAGCSYHSASPSHRKDQHLPDAKNTIDSAFKDFQSHSYDAPIDAIELVAKMSAKTHPNSTTPQNTDPSLATPASYNKHQNALHNQVQFATPTPVRVTDNDALIDMNPFEQHIKILPKNERCVGHQDRKKHHRVQKQHELMSSDGEMAQYLNSDDHVIRLQKEVQHTLNNPLNVQVVSSPESIHLSFHTHGHGIDRNNPTNSQIGNKQHSSAITSHPSYSYKSRKPVTKIVGSEYQHNRANQSTNIQPITCQYNNPSLPLNTSLTNHRSLNNSLALGVIPQHPSHVSFHSTSQMIFEADPNLTKVQGDNIHLPVLTSSSSSSSDDSDLAVTVCSHSLSPDSQAMYSALAQQHQYNQDQVVAKSIRNNLSHPESM